MLACYHLFFILTSSLVGANKDGIIPGQFIVRMPKLAMASLRLGKSDLLSGYAIQFKTLGIKPLDLLMRAASDLMLINATTDGIEKLKAQGVQVFPSMKLKPTALQDNSPWHLTVSIMLVLLFLSIETESTEPGQVDHLI